MKPLIGITTNTHDGEKIKTRSPDEKILYLGDRYCRVITDLGGLAVMLPVTRDRSLIRALLGRLDGLVLAGGSFDVPPSFYGEDPRPGLGTLYPGRSFFELELFRGAMKQDLPCLGICGGMQLINVAFGGNLYQDLDQERPQSLGHEQKVGKTQTSHEVSVLPGTMLHRIVTSGKSRAPVAVPVNSTHHQAVKDPGRGLAVAAVASDGVIEGIESAAHDFILGVQWHPEMLYDRHEVQARIIQAFIRKASRKKSGQ